MYSHFSRSLRRAFSAVHPQPNVSVKYQTTPGANRRRHRLCNQGHGGTTEPTTASVKGCAGLTRVGEIAASPVVPEPFWASIDLYRPARKIKSRSSRSTRREGNTHVRHTLCCRHLVCDLIVTEKSLHSNKDIRVNQWWGQLGRQKGRVEASGGTSSNC